MAAFARLMTTRGTRAAAALAPRVPALGQPVGRRCPSAAAAPLVPHTSTPRSYGRTGVGGLGFRNDLPGLHASTPRQLPSHGHAFTGVGGLGFRNDLPLGPDARLRPPYGHHFVTGVGVPDSKAVLKPDSKAVLKPDGGVPDSKAVLKPDGEIAEVAVGAAGDGGSGGDQGGGDGGRQGETLESLNAINDLFDRHLKDTRSHLLAQVKAMLMRSVSLILLGFFLEIVVLVIGVVLVIWFAVNMFKEGLSNTEEGKKLVSKFLHPLLDHIEDRYPKITWLGSRKTKK